MSQDFIDSENVDITPTPKILRTLGDIPFAAWQCMAELMDNSIDAFTNAENKGITIDKPRIDIHWSSDFVPLNDREIIVEDNGLGMELGTLQKAAKAGYSNNDPIHNLGLFGMGFNIATARLGEETIFLSATPNSENWVGIRINFEQLISNQTFSAPIVREPKKNLNESGTRIIVRKLKEGMFSEIRKKENAIRRQLETIYTPILNKNRVMVFVQGKQLFPNNHCVWGELRFVIRKGVKVEAIQRINRDLGEAYFDLSKNRYLSDNESFELEILMGQGNSLPNNIVQRSRRLKGWLGIQRYADPSDFGIDLIRNGRKILIRDKEFFNYENPDTATNAPEYPVELGSTVGGRIVGELNVDYLIPTYQKNGFDPTDKAWRLTVEAVRGAGPILPLKRKALGYDDENDSPLGKLINAYRRLDPGTKSLAIANSIAKEFAKKFFMGDPEYQSDEIWYKTAQEADREQSENTGKTPVNIGDIPSDDVMQYMEDATGINEIDKNNPKLITDKLSTGVPKVTPGIANSERDQLIFDSAKEESLSGTYSYNNMRGFDVTAWRLNNGQIKIQGKRVPYHFFQDGVEIDFFFDATHPLIAEYPITTKQLLLLGLAEKFALRDSGAGVSFQFAFLGLVENHLTDERINHQALQERAQSILMTIKERLPSLIGHRFMKVKEVIGRVEAEEEELANKLLEENSHLFEAYQSSSELAIQSLAYISDSTIKRLIIEYPEEFMDNKLFIYPYANIGIGGEAMQERLRKNALDRILSYISDIILIVQIGQPKSKYEQLRHANTLSIIEGLISK